MYKQINLFGTGIESISNAITSQRRVNCYYEPREDGDKEVIVICQTPGLTIFVTLPTFPIRGMIEINNYLYVVAGNALYQISTNGGYTQLATFGNSNTTTPVSMAFNTTELIIVDGIGGYIFPYTLIPPTEVSNQLLIAQTSILTSLCTQTGNV